LCRFFFHSCPANSRPFLHVDLPHLDLIPFALPGHRSPVFDVFYQSTDQQCFCLGYRFFSFIAACCDKISFVSRRDLEVFLKQQTTTSFASFMRPPQPCVFFSRVLSHPFSKPTRAHKFFSCTFSDVSAIQPVRDPSVLESGKPSLFFPGSPQVPPAERRAEVVASQSWSSSSRAVFFLAPLFF